MHHNEPITSSEAERRVPPTTSASRPRRISRLLLHKFLPRNVLQPLTVAVVGAYLLYLFICLLPLWYSHSKETAITAAQDSRVYRDALNKFQAELPLSSDPSGKVNRLRQTFANPDNTALGPPDSAGASIKPRYVSHSFGTYTVNAFVDISISRPPLQTVKNLVLVPRVRLDNLILYTGMLALLLGTIVFTVAASRSRSSFSSTLKVESDPLGSAEEGFNFNGRGNSVEELLIHDCDAAEEQADSINTRSLLLLGGGVGMALVGATVFYATLPQIRLESQAIPPRFWMQAIRAAGILVFVEGIAWFLLHQYRATMKDYMEFYRLFTIRVNVLAAARLLAGDRVSSEQLLLAARLLHDERFGPAPGSVSGSESGPIPNVGGPFTSLLTTLVGAVGDKSRSVLGGTDPKEGIRDTPSRN